MAAPEPTVLHLIEKARAAQQAHEQRHDVQLSFYEIPDWGENDLQDDGSCSRSDDPGSIGSSLHSQ